MKCDPSMPHVVRPDPQPQQLHLLFTLHESIKCIGIRRTQPPSIFNGGDASNSLNNKCTAGKVSPLEGFMLTGMNRSAGIGVIG